MSKAKKIRDRDKSAWVIYEADSHDQGGSFIWGTAFCPLCCYQMKRDTTIWGARYCPNCGQALNWH